MKASTAESIDTALASVSTARVGGLVIGNDAFFNSRIAQLAAVTTRLQIPTVHALRAFAALGGLMSYGSSITEGYRLVGSYAGRVLKGEKPAELPVVQTTKVELVLNLRTARAFGLDFPLSLIGRADETIE